MQTVAESRQLFHAWVLVKGALSPERWELERKSTLYVLSDVTKLWQDVIALANRYGLPNALRETLSAYVNRYKRLPKKADLAALRDAAYQRTEGNLLAMADDLPEQESLQKKVYTIQRAAGELGLSVALRSGGYRTKLNTRIKAKAAGGTIEIRLTDREILTGMQQRAIETTQHLNKTALNAYRQALFTNVYDLGMTTEDAVQAAGQMGMSLPIAERLARTEVHAGYNNAQHSLYKRSGINRKRWRSVGDRRVRDAHRTNEAAGWVDFNAAYPDGAMYPGDGTDDVNCRCVEEADLSDVELQPWDGSGKTPSTWIPPMPSGSVVAPAPEPPKKPKVKYKTTVPQSYKKEHWENVGKRYVEQVLNPPERVEHRLWEYNLSREEVEKVWRTVIDRVAANVGDYTVDGGRFFSPLLQMEMERLARQLPVDKAQSAFAYLKKKLPGLSRRVLTTFDEGLKIRPFVIDAPARYRAGGPDFFYVRRRGEEILTTKDEILAWAEKKVKHMYPGKDDVVRHELEKFRSILEGTELSSEVPQRVVAAKLHPELVDMAKQYVDDVYGAATQSAGRYNWDVRAVLDMRSVKSSKETLEWTINGGWGSSCKKVEAITFQRAVRKQLALKSARKRVFWHERFDDYYVPKANRDKLAGIVKEQRKKVADSFKSLWRSANSETLSWETVQENLRAAQLPEDRDYWLGINRTDVVKKIKAQDMNGLHRVDVYMKQDQDGNLYVKLFRGDGEVDVPCPIASYSVEWEEASNFGKIIQREWVPLDRLQTSFMDNTKLAANVHEYADGMYGGEWEVIVRAGR